MLRSATTPVFRSTVRSPIVARAQFQPLRQPMRMQSMQAASPVHSHTPMWIVLGVIVTGGGALFYYVKPIRELASKVHTTLETTKDAGSQASSFASQAASMAGLGPAFGISQLAYRKIQEAGGVSTFFEGLSEDVRNSDVAGALEKIKKVGGKEVEPYIAKAEKALKDAGGKAQDVDWKNVLEGLKEEVGDDFKGVISFITNYVPASGPIVAALASGDFSKISEKIKAEGGDQLKDLEATAQKLYSKAQAATKDGKGSLEDIMKTLKDADGEDLDKVIKQVKDLAKKAGIPADMIESWIQAKGGKIDTDALVKKAQSYASAGQQAAEHFDTDKVISSVKVVSPSLASLLALGLSAGGLKLGSAANGLASGPKEQFEQAKKQLSTFTEGLKSASGGVSKDLQARLATLQKDLEKTMKNAPTIEETTDAAKDSASKGKVTQDADSKKAEWEKAAKQLKEDTKKAVEGAMSDIEKAVKDGKAGESGKTVLELVKKYVQ